MAPLSTSLQEAATLRHLTLLPIIFVTVYLIASALIYAALGEGWGTLVFFCLGLPLSYVSVFVKDAFHNGELAALSCLLAGVLQYALLGYLAQRFLFGARREN
jgi:hypothetical protein